MMLVNFSVAGTGSDEAGDFLGDRGEAGLGGRDHAVAVLVGFLVGDNRTDVLDHRDGLGDVQLGSDNFPTLVEFARIAALRIEAPSSLRLFDQSAVLFTAEKPARVLVDAIDSWQEDTVPLVLHRV